MAPVVRTYQGKKKPSLSLKVPPISSGFRKEDSFDKLFGKIRSAHVFSSSSEASASHSRLELTPESFSLRLDSSSHNVFFSRKKLASDKVLVTPKGVRKKTGKKTEFISFEKLGSCNLKRLKRGCKKLERMLSPLCQSTPVKHVQVPASDTFSMLGLKLEGLRLEDSGGGADASFVSTRETSNCDRLADSPSAITATANSTPVLELIASRMKSVGPSGDSCTDFRGYKSDSPRLEDSGGSSFETSKCDRLGDSPSVVTATAHSTSVTATAHSTPVVKHGTSRMKSIGPSSDSFTNFRGFGSEVMTASMLQARYQWLDKQKSCALVQDTPRRARSMHDIILMGGVGSGSPRNSEDTASTVQPRKLLAMEKRASIPNSNVSGSFTVGMVRGQNVSLVGSPRASLHSNYFTTCDEMPLSSSASSGDCRDSCRSSEDLTRGSTERHEETVVRPTVPSQIPLHSFYEQRVLEPLHENSEDAEEESSSLSSKSSPAETPDSGTNRTPTMRRKSSRFSEERSPTGRSSIGRALATPDLNCVLEESDSDSVSSDQTPELPPLELVLMPGKKYRRSISLIHHFENQKFIPDNAFHNKGRNYKKSVTETVGRLWNNSFCGDTTGTPLTSLQSLKKRLTIRRSSLMRQMTPPPRRRSTVRPTIYETPCSVFSCKSSTRDSLPALLSRASMTPDMTFTSIAASPEDPGPTPKDAVLATCKQSDYVRFSDILNKECFSGAVKLGEGVYGEVFRITRGDRCTVIKIIPLEGNFQVNDAEQKTFEAILPEIVVSIELNGLLSEAPHRNVGFVEIAGVSLVQGRYSPELLKLWDQFDEEKGSDNDNPKIFDEGQLYLVIEQADGGTDLQHFSFSTARQTLSIFKQIAFSLAVAECAIEFEHRDLHWGNVLVSKTKEPKISYVIEGKEYSFPTYGVKATIIDYTLSRITYKNSYVMCCNLSQDPDLFLGTGDYQFEVYRQMKRDVRNEWNKFIPKTNCRWLFYLLLKMQQGVQYRRKTAKIHNDSMYLFKQISSWIEECSSAREVAEALINAGKP